MTMVVDGRGWRGKDLLKISLAWFILVLSLIFLVVVRIELCQLLMKVFPRAIYLRGKQGKNQGPVVREGKVVPVGI
ncbi:hypothetical protein PP707_04355 [Acetobacter pasteurianus]|nr:hypothetical protein [Acetobacter pasteurianus]